MTGPTPRPPAEVAVDADLVGRLLEEQHPDLAHLPRRVVPSGWDNTMVRLGDDLVARLPRRALSAGHAEHELRWLPELAPRLPLPIPVPVRAGRPGCGYPWAWSVCPWLPGRSAHSEPLADPAAEAVALGRFVAALHVPAPVDAPVNPYRGVPLASRTERLEAHVAVLDGRIDAVAVRACWAPLAATPAWAGPPVWLHGDLHPDNLLVHDGRLAAVVDFGDLTAGDPGVDLAAAWMLLPAAARPHLRDTAGADDATWARARGWALALALAMLSGSADDPVISGIGQRTLAAVLADPG
jgi:aminoglycoside phosphotransferase (APT) family kinase protein